MKKEKKKKEQKKVKLRKIEGWQAIKAEES